MSEEGQPWRVLQRVILPSQGQMDTVPLYVDAGTASGVQLPTSNLDGKQQDPAQISALRARKRIWRTS